MMKKQSKKPETYKEMVKRSSLPKKMIENIIEATSNNRSKYKKTDSGKNSN